MDGQEIPVEELHRCFHGCGLRPLDYMHLNYTQMVELYNKLRGKG